MDSPSLASDLDILLSDPEFNDILDQPASDVDINECTEGGEDGIEIEDDRCIPIPPDDLQRVRNEPQSVESDTDSSTSSETSQPISMPPPPEQSFDSFEALETFIHEWSLQYGYELVRGKNTKKNREGVICT